MAVLPFSASARILSGSDIASQPLEAFNAELAVFNSVAQGIELQLAICEIEDDCAPAVARTEVAKMIETLDVRINQISGLESAADSTDGLADVLNEYRAAREQYAGYMRDLQSLPATVPATPPATQQPTRSPVAPAAPSMDFFEDVDEPLPGE